MKLPDELAAYQTLIYSLEKAGEAFVIGQVLESDVAIIYASEYMRKVLGEALKGEPPNKAGSFLKEPLKIKEIIDEVTHKGLSRKIINLPSTSEKTVTEAEAVRLSGDLILGRIKLLVRDKLLMQLYDKLDGVKTILHNSPANFYQAVLATAISFIPGAEAGSLWLFEDGRFTCQAHIGFDDGLIGQSVSYEQELIWYGLSENELKQAKPRLIAFDDIRERRGRLDEHLPGSARKIMSNLLVPVAVNGDVLGTFNLDNLHDEEAFVAESVSFGKVFAKEIATFLESHLKEQRLRRRLQLLNNIVQVNRTARLAETQGDLFINVIHALHAFMEMSSQVIFLLERGGEFLRVTASTDSHLPAGSLLPRGRGASWLAIEEKRTIIIDDVESDGRSAFFGKERASEAKPISFLSTPIKSSRGKILGTITVNSIPGSGFQQEEIAFIEAAAEALGMSLDRIKALKEATKRAYSYKKLLSLSAQIETIDSPKRIAEYALKTILDLTRYRAGAFFGVKNGKIGLQLIVGNYPAAMREAYLNLDLNLGEGLIGESIMKRRSLAIFDYSRYENALSEFKSFKIRSVMVEPLWVQNSPYGALVLYSFNDGVLPSDDTQNLMQLTAKRIERALERIKHLLSLRETRNAMFQAFGVALERRDYETSGHTERVAALATKLAAEFGFSGKALEAVRWGAYLHDLGKLAIPDSILLKPGPLSEEEWRVMRSHTEIGYEMLRSIPFLPLITRNIVRYHHERWDGSGYNFGLKGDEIPLEARIFSAVDIYDALTNDRPYKQKWSLQESLSELRNLAAKALDAEVVTALTDTLLSKPTANG